MNPSVMPVLEPSMYKSSSVLTSPENTHECARRNVPADQFYDVSIALTDAAGNRGTAWDITAYRQW